jgi:hypothetical protein
MGKERKIKSQRKESWTALRVEVAKSIQANQLDVTEVSTGFSQIIERIIAESTINHEILSNNLAFRLKNSHVHFTIFFTNITVRAYLVLDEIVNEQNKYWLYEGTVGAMQELLNNVYYGKFVLTSKKYDWVLGFDQHDILIAKGSIVSRVERHRTQLEL